MREEGVFGAREPLGQRLPAVARKALRQRRGVERGGNHTRPALGMVHLAVPRQVDFILLRLITALRADASEERGHLIILVLRPALVGVVVTASALDAHAEEDLGGRLRQLLRPASDTEVVG